MKRISLSCFVLVSAACGSTTTQNPVGLAPVVDAGADVSTTPDDAAVVLDSGVAVDSGGTTCSAAIEQTLRPVDKVSTGMVSILSDTAGVRLVYVNAFAGGTSAFANNPYTFVNLETATRVDVTDKTSRMSTAWDLALKRYVIYTNDTDGGPGQGGATHVTTAFDAVTSADAKGLLQESFFDKDCNAKTDMIGGLSTTFSNWYGYDNMTNKLSPNPETYIVKGGTGKLYKVAIENYYASPDGGTATDGGVFVLRVAAL